MSRDRGPSARVLALVSTLALASGCLSVEQFAGVQESQELGPERGGTSLLLVTTSLGTMVFALHVEFAPATTGHFLKLARSGFYDGTRVHRVVHDADAPRVAAGDPWSRDPSQRVRWGTGGPGHTVEAEFPRNATGDLRLVHDRVGILSLEREPQGGVGSRFTITLGPASALDGNQSVFGYVANGLGVLRAMGDAPLADDGAPAEDIVIRRVFG